MGGCGRFFEGTAEQMHKALIEVLGQLPDSTKVFCGHEYSLQNLKFAAHVEPDNEEIKKKISWSQSMREKNMPTVCIIYFSLLTYTIIIQKRIDVIIYNIDTYITVYHVY